MHQAGIFSLGEYIRTLRLTSELVDLRVGYAKRIQRATLIEPLLTGLCINMMHAVASYLCRGIEAVITGLTRNQFVDNTTRGFESLPLRQILKDTPCECPLIFYAVGRSRSLLAKRARVRISRLKIGKLAWQAKSADIFA